MKRFLSALPLFLAAASLRAQDATESPAATSDEAANAAGVLAALGCGVLPCILWFALIIGMAIYVYRDATRRRMDNAILLTILTVVTGPLGLVIYLLMRPKGDVPPPSSGV
jgi:hypothetical protein